MMKALEFRAHVHAQAGIQVGKRFIHQEYFGPVCQHARQGNALLLPAAHFARIAVFIAFHLHFGQCLFYAFFHFLFRHFLDLERER